MLASVWLRPKSETLAAAAFEPHTAAQDAAGQADVALQGSIDRRLAPAGVDERADALRREHFSAVFGQDVEGAQGSGMEGNRLAVDSQLLVADVDPVEPEPVA